ncbi:MAG: hypothetical protein WCF07_03545 [Nitrososphaeraceae archaeon]
MSGIDMCTASFSHFHEFYVAKAKYETHLRNCMYVIMMQAGGGADYGNQKKFMCIATFLPLKQQQIESGIEYVFLNISLASTWSCAL